MRKLALLAILSFTTKTVITQSRFTQFYSSPLLFNPANTGRFNKSYRIGGASRNDNTAMGQYAQNSFFFDSKILNSLFSENDCFAIGLLALSEQNLGEGIKNSYLSLAFAYHKGLDEEGKNQISLGFQTNFSRKKLTPPNFIFEDQILSWAQEGYTNIDIFQIRNVDVSYIDLNAGIVYQGVIKGKSLFSFGAGIYHITKPKKTFQGGELSLSRELWNHVSYENNLPNNRKLFSAILINTSNKELKDILFGLDYQIPIRKNYLLELGSWFRINNIKGTSLIPKFSLLYRNFALGVSYDMDFSQKNNTQKGATEITLTYIGAKNRVRFQETKFIKY